MNLQLKGITYKKIAWTISDFSTLKTNVVYFSEVFTIGNRNWQVLLYLPTHGEKFLSIYLFVPDAGNLPQGCSINANFTFTVVNHFSREKSIEKAINFKFWAKESFRGCPSFMPLTTLLDPSSGYILDDKCIVEVEFFVIKSEGIVPAIYFTYPFLSKESEKVPADDVVDFKDLGKVEKAFVPLLEEVCSWHPSLMECKKNRSSRFTEWTFNALGHVLQFLKKKKWKDMNEEACEQLRYLWEELEISKLELSWLEPLVKSALNMKGYSEKVEKVKRLKGNLLLLENEMKLFKEKLTEMEQSVEMIKIDLVNAKEGFEEKDLDAEIGYGKS